MVVVDTKELTDEKITELLLLYIRKVDETEKFEEWEKYDMEGPFRVSVQRSMQQEGFSTGVILGLLLEIRQLLKEVKKK